MWWKRVVGLAYRVFVSVLPLETICKGADLIYVNPLHITPAPPRLATVKNPQHDEPFVVVAILEYVGGIENLQDDLPVLLVAGDRTSE